MINKQTHEGLPERPAPQQAPRRRRSTRRWWWYFLALLLATLSFAAGTELHRLWKSSTVPAPVPVASVLLDSEGSGVAMFIHMPFGRTIGLDAGAEGANFKALPRSFHRMGATGINALLLTGVASREIGGVPQLLNVIHLRGPLLIPCSLTDFLHYGGSDAEAAVNAADSHDVPVEAWNRYVVTHPNILGDVEGAMVATAAQPMSHRYPALVVKLQYGASNVLYLNSLTSAETQQLTSDPTTSACRILVLPPILQSVSGELLAATTPDIAVMSPSGGDDTATVRLLQAADARIINLDQSPDVSLNLPNLATQEITVPSPVSTAQPTSKDSPS